MAKGVFTQGICLLTDGQTNVEDVIAALGDKFTVARRVPAQEHWQFGGPAVLLEFRTEDNGGVVVDVVSQPWPDHMGDPKAEPVTFGAWSLAQFGPLTYPGSLKRASQHASAWEPGRTMAERHCGFIRIRMSYALGAKDDDPVFPEGYDPVAELQFASSVVLSVFEAPGVLCYFNPNGELLLGHDLFREMWAWGEREDTLPLELFTNVRGFALSEDFGFMDTVGNGQLDIQDVEASFPMADYKPRDVSYYLRNVSHYLLDSHPDFRLGDSIDGPGETNLSWTAEVLENGLADPPRRVLRIYPKAHSRAIHALLPAATDSP